MIRDDKHKRILFLFYGIVLLAVMLSVAGCGGKGDKGTQAEQNQSEQEETRELYLIMEHDQAEESFLLRSLEDGMETYMEYGFSTHFRDKYGTYTTASHFMQGRVIVINSFDEEGYIKEMQLSDQVWEQEGIKRFSIDTEKGIFTIADSRYSIQDKVILFSNGIQTSFSAISKDDILTVVGMDKKILAITVTTGHGTLALRNTDLFTNSFLQLNQNIFAMITGDMDMDLPEGTYTLKVANDGWGGTTEIEIKRGEKTEIDLDTLKGEGKKKGFITFEINAEDVVVRIDNEKIDPTKPVELTYGTHLLEVKAEGYIAWKKYLYVNSAEATIEIELEEEETDSEEETEETMNTESTQETETTETTENTESTQETETTETTENTESTQETETTETTENTEGTEAIENVEDTERKYNASQSDNHLARSDF